MKKSIKTWLSDETGDTNIIPMIIVIAVIAVLVFLFRPYITELVQNILGLFK